jgi:TonB family protein
MLIAGLLAVMLQGAVTVAPSQFYIVSVFFSDNGAAFYYRLIEVKPDGSGALVRYSRIAAASLYCPRIVVQTAEGRLDNTSLAALVGTRNLCAVKQRALNAALKKYRRTEAVFEAVSFGIVAQCGSSLVSLGLPMSQRVDLERLQRAEPQTAHLWELASEIADRTFGPQDVFHDRTDADDLILQRAGAGLAPELASGRYDVGLAAAVKGNVGTWRSPSFRSLLERYRGPVNTTESGSGYVSRLLNAQEFHFSHFVPPKYPTLAMQARVQGQVALRLTLNAATGEVVGVAAISGHPLLNPSAIEAAKQWRFAPGSTDSQVLDLTLDFALRCP